MSEPDPAEQLFAKLNPEVRPIMQALRDVIKETVPQVSEGVHLGWDVIHYKALGTKTRDILVALSPQRAYVNLEFGDGIDLADPAHRLEGTGKRIRHVKVRSADDARQPQVRALLQTAARHRGLEAGL